MQEKNFEEGAAGVGMQNDECRMQNEGEGLLV
jgi:hypothetical protein